LTRNLHAKAYKPSSSQSAQIDKTEVGGIKRGINGGINGGINETQKNI